MSDAYYDAQLKNDITRNVRQYRDLDLFFSKKTERKDINVLTDPNIRIKLSEHSGWPTIPQLFVKGELIGGADITNELHQSGQLLDILDKANS